MTSAAESREASGEGVESTRRRSGWNLGRGELERLLGDDQLTAPVREVRRLLGESLFQRQDDLDTTRAAALAYRRARFLARGLGLRSGELRRDPTWLYAVHEWLGVVDGAAVTVFSIHYCLALGSIAELGEGREELAPWLAELERMDSVGVFLATELGYGNNVASLETQAIYEPEAREFVLQSPTPRSLKFMPNTAFAVPKVAVVMARLMSLGRDCGVFPFVVRLRDENGAPCPGVRIASLPEKPGYALDNGLTLFEGVRVPKYLLLSGSDSVLHEDGRFESRIPSRRGRFLSAMGRVQTGRVCFTSTVVAMLRAATWIVMGYAAQRLTSAPGARSVPILRYRNVQRDVFGALASAYALTFVVRRVQRAYRERTRDNEKQVFRLVASVKAVASTEVAFDLYRLRERCGAVGMLSANRVIDYLNQVQGLVTAEGDNQLMLLKIGRQLWDAGVPSALSSPPSLHDLGTATAQQFLSLFRFRESGLAQELRANVFDTRGRTREAFSIWNENVNATMAAASSHGLRIVAESFCTAVEDARDPEVSAALTELFRLWCIEQVERNAGWFLAHGCLEPAAVIELSRARDQQCARIESSSSALVDAFGLDNSILQAPIAEDDYTERYESFFRGASDSIAMK